MTSTKPKISFAGLGAMGGGMATNLVKQGFEVTGYDVFHPLLDRFVESGGKPSYTPKEAAASADFMISMVANAAQTSSLLFEGDDAAVHGLGKGKTLILCSTISPAFVSEIRKRLDEEFKRSDIKLLDCPVSGGTLRAGDGELSIFSSGPDEDLQEAKQVLQAMSTNLYNMGAIGNGAKAKTIHQLLAAINIATTAEVLGLAATIGLNTQSVFDAIQDSEGASFMFGNRGPHALTNDWHPYSALGIILKDAMIVTDTARKEQFPVPLACTAECTYLQGAQAGMLKDDDAKIVQLYLPPSQGDLVYQMTKADAMMTASYQISKDTIINLLCGIHLAASIEAMAFGKKLGVDGNLMYDIISKAAGSSGMFTKHIPSMLEKDQWKLSDCPDVEEVGRKLSEAVEKCRKINYPCPMAAAALQQFHFAKLAGKVIGNQGRGR
ncbi:Hypothetical protein R9X50_00269100 [Acrodontium crateriforme]|uniref:3-hydroxyisobutyrate dehydrogenase n=1 Tax=Acrodontium crateriforme TaxID=150365 RepID=A0AAQ3M2L7_9PEZI|nr:Hypothetical protein R9X50_00269100 [Acrodontium crateriforme]